MATEGFRLYGGSPADYAANLATGAPVAGAVYEVYDARFGNRVTDLRDLSDQVIDVAVSDNVGYVRFQAPESEPRSLYLQRDGEFYRIDADDIGRTVDELEAGDGGTGGGVLIGEADAQGYVTITGVNEDGDTVVVQLPTIATMVKQMAWLFWDGATGTQPQRTAATANPTQMVVWIQPETPPESAGYAPDGYNIHFGIPTAS